MAIVPQRLTFSIYDSRNRFDGKMSLDCPKDYPMEYKSLELLPSDWKTL
jgi:hypothetical protein